MSVYERCCRDDYELTPTSSDCDEDSGSDCDDCEDVEFDLVSEQEEEFEWTGEHLVFFNSSYVCNAVHDEFFVKFLNPLDNSKNDEERNVHRKSIYDEDENMEDQSHDKRWLKELIKPYDDPNEWYLDAAEKGKCNEMKALFEFARLNTWLDFDSNSVNTSDKSALRLAVENEDVDMCCILMDNKVEIEDCIFHAIDRNFLAGVEIILRHDACLTSRIVGDNFNFPAGISPMIMAACLNKYKCLELLFTYGHRLEETVDWWDGINFTWESGNNRHWFYKAKASPSYVTLINEEKKSDPMKYCIDLIRDLRVLENTEHEFSAAYHELQAQVEDYMCALLNEVRSSDELSSLFGYEFVPITDSKSAWMAFAGASSRMSSSSWLRLDLLESACEADLMRFVTHQNTQLSLSYLKYRYTPYLREGRGITRTIIRKLIGVMYPVLSIFYIIAPRTEIGGLLALPAVSFESHVWSDLIFIGILISNIIYKTKSSVYLGLPPNPLEWAALSFILGKWLQEFQELFKQGRRYFRDYWNFNDLTYLSLFSVGVIFRGLDYSVYGEAASRPNATLYRRDQWETYEPRLIAESVQAWAYVFVFLRVSAITRNDRALGPLQVSLARMLADIMHFLCIFGLVIFAFAMGLSELFWFYGTDDGKAMICAKDEDEYECDNKLPFNSIGESLKDLFWAIFGHFEVDHLHLAGQHNLTESVGRALIGVYHVVAVVVLLNMLIAMMAQSYDAISRNGETEWKFHRTELWMRYIRDQVVRPPPMNLVPNFAWISRKMADAAIHLVSCCRRHCCAGVDDDSDDDEEVALLPKRRPRGHHHAEVSQGPDELTAMKKDLVLRALVRRYKQKVLLNAACPEVDEQRDNVDHVYHCNHSSAGPEVLISSTGTTMSGSSSSVSRSPPRVEFVSDVAGWKRRSRS